jgi:hypothetical protein
VNAEALEVVIDANHSACNEEKHNSVQNVSVGFLDVPFLHRKPNEDGQSGNDEEGYKLARSLSVSRAFVPASAARSVLQNLHLMATALMVSPQTGQALVSSSIDRSFHGRIITQTCAGDAGTGFS